LADSSALSGVSATPRKGLRRVLNANLLVGLGVFVAFVAVKLFVAEDLVRSVLRWIGGLGAAGPLIFIGIYIVAPVG
jgi:uncharacterized membrane protein YdjX (TVP38/TMEM64 family)